jgi:hypothetical protein
MRYEPPPTPEQLATVERWLAESGPLFVDDYYRHYGTSSPQYFIRSVADLLDLISLGRRPDRMISVFRSLYPLRGFADQQLLASALALVRADESYSVLFLDEQHYYPHECQRADGGFRGHADLRRDLQQPEVAGKAVAVGPCPFGGDDSWIYTSPDVLRLDMKAVASETA